MNVQDLQETPTWRGLLGKIIKDPQEKQYIAHESGVSPLTLTRWVSGESKPRPQNLRLLVNAFPLEYRKTFLELMAEEFGFSLEYLDETPAHEIPSDFYAQILDTYVNLPRRLHFNVISDTILQQALKQLDPTCMGVEVTIAQCMPPTREGKVCSLRESVGRGTPPWDRDLEQRTRFLGAESLAGYVVATGRPRALQRCLSVESVCPVRWVDGEESVMAYPLMRADRVAGCFLVSSTQADYFLLPARRALIQSYAELLTMIFEPQSFYRLQDISLGRMPPYKMQRASIASFQQRIMEIMHQSQLSIIEAEQLVWQQIEEDLLRLGRCLAF